MTGSTPAAGEGQAQGGPPDGAPRLAAQRSRGVLHHLATLVTLGRDMGWPVEKLVAWNLDRAAAHGHYDEWVHRHGAGDLDAFLAEFLYGRRMLYDDSQVLQLEDGYEVRTPLWFYGEPPEVLFYCDLTAEELSEYIVALARENARRCGVRLNIRHETGVEIAVMKKEDSNGTRPSAPQAGH